MATTISYTSNLTVLSVVNDVDTKAVGQNSISTGSNETAIMGQDISVNTSDFSSITGSNVSSFSYLYLKNNATASAGINIYLAAGTTTSSFAHLKFGESMIFPVSKSVNLYAKATQNNTTLNVIGVGV